MKYFLKTQWIWISSFLLLCLITAGLLLIKTNYEIVSPAIITRVDKYIEIENDDEYNTNINSVSVYGFSNASLLNYIISIINPFSSEIKQVDYYNTSNDYLQSQGTIHRQMSIDNAIAAAYSKAGYDVKIEFTGYKVTSVLKNALTDASLGDLIISVEGIQLTEEVTFNDVVRKCYFEENKNFVNYNYKRDGQTKSGLLTLYFLDEEAKINNTPTTGISLEPTYSYKIDENAPKYSWQYGGSIGPSGGLMQALSVYEQLTGAKLTKNLKIAGTGTIDIYGNAGLISGTEQKICIANACNCDIFFVPVDKSYEDVDKQNTNWYEAKNASKLLKIFGQTKMEIVPVSSLDEIIEYLEDYHK